jgi:hypothetical protein
MADLAVYDCEIFDGVPGGWYPGEGLLMSHDHRSMEH